MDNRLLSYAGKVVMITGASSGIERATARASARRGARICIGDVRAGAGETVELIRKAGGEALFVRPSLWPERRAPTSTRSWRHRQPDFRFGQPGSSRCAALPAILSSVAPLVSASANCTDTTGTVLRTEMTVERLMTASGSIRATGVGYEPQGRVEVGGAVRRTAHACGACVRPVA